MRLKALVEYEGTAYHGWQVQPCIPTVQGKVQKAMENIFGPCADIKYASRTDKGVHSRGQVISFNCPEKFTPEKAEKAINYYLPEDIMVKKVKRCLDSFNPRYENKGKIYVYRILNDSCRDYMLRNYVWHIPAKINWKLVKKGMKIIEGENNFSLFCSPRGGKKNTIIKIKKIKLKKKKNLYCIYYKADYFLMHMIRHLTAFLVAVGRGKETLNDLSEKLEGKGLPCSRVAPAKGLELKKVL